MRRFLGSDVIHLNILGQHIICLNSVKAAADLLDRRGANYCDRPRFTLFEVYVMPCLGKSTSCQPSAKKTT